MELSNPRAEFVAQDLTFRSHRLESVATKVVWSDDPETENKCDVIQGIANPDPPVVGK